MLSPSGTLRAFRRLARPARHLRTAVERQQQPSLWCDCRATPSSTLFSLSFFSSSSSSSSSSPTQSAATLPEGGDGAKSNGPSPTRKAKHKEKAKNKDPVDNFKSTFEVISPETVAKYRVDGRLFMPCPTSGEVKGQREPGEAFERLKFGLEEAKAAAVPAFLGGHDIVLSNMREATPYSYLAPALHHLVNSNTAAHTRKVLGLLARSYGVRMVILCYDNPTVKARYEHTKTLLAEVGAHFTVHPLYPGTHLNVDQGKLQYRRRLKGGGVLVTTPDGVKRLLQMADPYFCECVMNGLPVVAVDGAELFKPLNLRRTLEALAPQNGVKQRRFLTTSLDWDRAPKIRELADLVLRENYKVITTRPREGRNPGDEPIYDAGELVRGSIVTEEGRNDPREG